MHLYEAHAVRQVHRRGDVLVDVDRASVGGGEEDGVAQLGEGLGERAPAAGEAEVRLAPRLG